jgi:hypothetical protein
MRKLWMQKIWLATATVLLTIISCQKEISINGGGNNTTADLSAKVTAGNISGFVTDENDAPVSGAMVKIGTQTISTDGYGYFEAGNVEVSKNAATVTVTQPGYFPGIRTFMAATDKNNFVRIKLLPKTNSGNISAANGGSVMLTNGLKIALPADAVVNATSGVAYTGTINVAAQWIDPTGADRDLIMPGDLRAIDAGDNMKLLTTYGMTAVELTGSAGEKLQVAPGKKAMLTMPLPASIAGTAPATIPLWHFDETRGLWIEEGSAVKVGNTYEGEVSHFSFWNCDVPNNYVQIDMTVKTPGNQPVQFAQVKITDLANNQSAIGYTDSAGYVSGAVPSNANLKVEIFYGYSCGVPLHTQTVASSNSNLSLGTVTITNTTSLSNLTGTVTNCGGAPVTNGVIFLNTTGQYLRYNLSNTGGFNIPYYLCNSTSVAATIIVEDYTALQQSAEIQHTIVSGLNALGTIQACGTSSSQFMNITVNGSPETFTHPADSLNYFYNNQSGSSVEAMRFSTGTVVTTGFDFNHTGITAGGNYVITNFYSSVIGPPNSTSLPVNQSSSSVTITEYGAIGEFVAGNYTINATGPAPANTPYAITGSFRMRRNN